VPFDIDPTAGVALSPDHGRDLDVLVLRAQLAMTQARRSGQAAAVYVQEAQDLTHRRMAILASLHAALLDPSRHHEIAVVYQPQVAVESGRLVGAEALVRWTHPEWGPVSPDELVEAVESSKVMHLLTLHMLDRVCAQAHEWNSAGFRLRVAVNVSLQDLHHPDFPEQVAQILRQHDLRPDQLTIEITERTIVGDAERVATAAARISALGVGLSLDDFGTGYASLQQLRILPLKELKIDKSYVRGMTDDDAQRAIVTATYHLAAALGLSVVAEGVEDGGTVAALAALPGIIGQGWRFGRPAPPDAFYQEWHQRAQPPDA
jgi:EAL domain-containing protein (putative c-di-GMP-specific phosphodiesterase class I)